MTEKQNIYLNLSQLIIRNQNNIFNVLKIAILILLISNIFISCDTNDEFIDLPKESKIKVTHISFDELKNSGDFEQVIQNVERKYSQLLQGKNVTSNDSSFVINTDFIYQTTLDSIVNYTFMIERPELDSLKIENLIISKNTNTNETLLKIFEFDKENSQMQLYDVDLNAVNIDSLGLDKVAYVYGEAIEIDDCVGVSYAPCSGNGTADGHDVTSNCNGSSTTFDFTNCHSRSGGGGDVFDTSSTGDNGTGEGSVGNEGGGDNGGDNRGDNGGSVGNNNDPNDNQNYDPTLGHGGNRLPGAISLVAISTNLNVVNLNNFLATPLNKIQETWVENNALQAEELISFLESNSNSVEAQEFISELITLINLDGNLNQNAFEFILATFNNNSLDSTFLNSVLHLIEVDYPNSNTPPDLILLPNLFSEALAEHLFIKATVLRHNHPNWSKWKLMWMLSKDIVHISLDIFGTIPVAGEIADLTNGVLYTIEGDGLNATLSYSNSVPLVGWATLFTKYGLKIVNSTQTAYTIGTKVKLTWKILTDGSVYFGSNSTCRRQLRKALGLAPFAQDARQAHHIIPLNLQSHPAIQKAAKSSNPFHLNEAINGLPLGNTVHNGSHFNYDLLIKGRLDDINLNQPLNDIFDEVANIIQNVKSAVNNSPTTHINLLNF